MDLLTCRDTRRAFLHKSGALLGAVTVMGPLAILGCESNEAEAGEISATEDLMREHGVLRRVLLIFANLESRLREGRSFPPGVLTGAAGLIRRFIQDYHEKLEEEYVFPRFPKTGKLAALVQVLRRQHEVGRRITAFLLAQGAAAGANAEGRDKLAEHLRTFAAMYRPHAAREDTVLFPAFQAAVSPEDFSELGDKFEEREQTLFGKRGLKKIVAQVAGLEETLGIEDLSQFTPPL